jgi:SAM-dependent methyltransferase
MVMTNDDDPIEYYYKLWTGWLYRRRLEIGLALLGNQYRPRILEVGYGSGILLPTLAARCDALYAVDLHKEIAPVQAMLAQEGCQAELYTGNILALDFPSQIFDAVICLSVLEHLVPRDLARAVDEVFRVLRPGGIFVPGFPVRNAATSTFYKLVGFDPSDLHPSGHREIVDAVRARFKEARLTWFPRWTPLDLALYVGMRGERTVA